MSPSNCRWGPFFFTFWEGESYIRLEVHSLFISDALRGSNIKHKIQFSSKLPQLAWSSSQGG